MQSPPDTIDERFEELAAQLRAARPEPSAALAERVRELARQPMPERRRRPRFTLPGFRPLVAAASLAAVAAAAVGITTQLDGAGSEREAVRDIPRTRALEPFQAESAKGDAATPESATDDTRAAAPPPSATRLQDYRAELRIRVDSVGEVSRATAQAMRTARSLGGYVVSAQLDRPGGEDGDSVLAFRIPVSRVQEAIVRLTALGELLSQRISLADLQAPLERQTDAVAQLRTRVRQLERQLRTRTLSEEERARLQLELLQTRQQLADQIRQRDDTLRRGRLALVSLALTTRSEERVAPAPPGETEQRLRDALSALVDMASWALYAVVVAGPFLLLAALAVVLDRRRRRRADDRLLERA